MLHTGNAFYLIIIFINTCSVIGMWESPFPLLPTLLVLERYFMRSFLSNGYNEYEFCQTS